MGIYKNEVEKPAMPSEGRLMPGMGCEDMKSEGDPIVYGQASKQGCKSDTGKIKSQMKEYHWD
jgi:hypothetical protein